MKRFLLFTGYDYYPSGGWNDFDGSFETAEECEKFAASLNTNWAHWVDTETKQKHSFKGRV